MNLQTFPCLPLSLFSQTITEYIEVAILNPICTTSDQTAFHSKLFVELHLCVDRLVQYGPCSSEVFFKTLIYLQRIEKLNGFGFVNVMTVSRLFVVGLMVASKYYDDDSHCNAVFAKIVGMTKEELMRLEMEFLSRIGYKLYVSEQEFFSIFQAFHSKESISLLSILGPHYSLSKTMHEILFQRRKLPDEIIPLTSAIQKTTLLNLLPHFSPQALVG